jgi:glycosyltransferase involved in cell wall biosynthesis
LRDKILLSICIPTYNRKSYLRNCLESIYLSKLKSNINLEVCISDNASTESIADIVKIYKKKIKIRFNRNKTNYGFGVNFLKTINMAKGEFVWTIGNDDLLSPYALERVHLLFKKHENIDFFFINAAILNSKFVFKYKQPFNTKNLPVKLETFSKINKNYTLPFFDLVNPDISWDFLLGIFLTIYRRKKFISKINSINKKKITDTRVWSTFDNTAPHAKIFSSAFKNSLAFVQSKPPLLISLHGNKEWGDLYPFISIVRIPEVLDEYRKNGLPFFQYLKCKNFVFRRFIPNIYYIFKNKKTSGYEYINWKRYFFYNIWFPSIYFFIFKFFFRKIKQLIKNIL